MMPDLFNFDPLEARVYLALRTCSIACASIAGTLGLAVAAFDLAPASLFILIGSAFAFLAVRDQRRADAIFARGVAAALAEGIDPIELAEAA